MTPSLPLADPASSLPETAKRILRAAQQLLIEEGAGRLTYAAIERRSGENRALIAYYYGNKAGLIAALVDATIHDAAISLVRQVREHPSGSQGVRLTGIRIAEIAEDEPAFRAFFEVLPIVLRDRVLRSKVAAVYSWYRELFTDLLVECGLPAGARPDKWGALVTAALDGLAIQAALDAEFDLGNAALGLGELVSGLADGRTASPPTDELADASTLGDEIGKPS